MRKTISVILAAVMLCGLAGCSKNEEQISEPESSVVSHSEDGFDIEVVRKSLMVKGVSFELPKRVGDLDDGWTYKKRETHYVDNTGLADFFYNGEEMFVAGIGDFKDGKEYDGFIYDIALETDDCSIGGIIPNVSTKDEVVSKFGEPAKINVFEERGLYRYIYGVQDSEQKLFKIEHSQMFTVVFYADSDVVQGVRVVYNTLRD